MDCDIYFYTLHLYPLSTVKKAIELKSRGVKMLPSKDTSHKNTVCKCTSSQLNLEPHKLDLISQVIFIYIELFTIQIVSKQLYRDNWKIMQQSLFWLYSRSRGKSIIVQLKFSVD